MKALTNKTRAVLDLLEREGVELTCKEIAERVMDETPCGSCGGTGSVEGLAVVDPRCRRCYGRGKQPFYYGDAYQCLQQLMKLGLVSRRNLINEWGDKTPSHVYKAAERVSQERVDELEELFQAASHGEESS